MKNEEILQMAKYVLFNDITIREIAEKTGYSKTCVHLNLMKLDKIDYEIFLAVRARLSYRALIAHKLGGEATRRKFKHDRHKV